MRNVRSRAAIDAGTEGVRTFEDAESGLRELAKGIESGCKRINAILGERTGVRLIRLEKPLRLRLRYGDKRVGFDLDDINQLIRIGGLGLEGEYQFVPGAQVPALINVSIVSTEANYGEAITASTLLRLITKDSELPKPPHLDDSGPLKL